MTHHGHSSGVTLDLDRMQVDVLCLDLQSLLGWLPSDYLRLSLTDTAPNHTDMVVKVE